MTKEQEEAIERCNKLIETEHSNWIGITNQKAIETVLNMLKENSAEIHQKNTELAEKNAEIEKYKKLLADNLARELNNSIKAKEKADTDLDDLNKGWQVELEKYKQLYNKALDDAVTTSHDNMKKDKMIDLMAEYISDLDIDEDICKKQSDNNCDDINREVECKECIKQYFERKESEYYE